MFQVIMESFSFAKTINHIRINRKLAMAKFT